MPADRYLIEAAGASRYRMRGLLPEHARGLAERVETEDTRYAAVRRAAETYLRFAVAPDRVVNPLRPVIGPLYTGYGPTAVSKKEALDRLDAERTNLRAAVHTAVDHGRDELGWQMCEALWGLYFSGPSRARPYRRRTPLPGRGGSAVRVDPRPC